MKIIHLADLHIGKRVNEFSMIDDQKHILNQILEIIDKEKPDAVIIAGDVYDKQVPSIEAVELLDSFIAGISKRKTTTFIISGNHDSAERLAFGSSLMAMGKIYISPVYNGKISKYTLKNDFGSANFYLLPFVKPSHVKRFFPDEKIESYTDAIKVVIDNLKLDTSEINILIAHQFVTGASRTESEEISVGGLDNVDASVFEDFDYVALGHIHRPQKIGTERIRYCGTPLKYSFSEVNDTKSVSIIEINSKEDFNLRMIPLIPKRDMRKIRGTYEELTTKTSYENTNTDDYIHVTLTDEFNVADAIQKLRVIYKNIMKLEYDNIRTRESRKINLDDMVIENKNPLEIFSEFYKLQNNKEMNDEQKEIIKKIMEEVWEENK
ncbi:exonuclease SbcCD subunit D [Leptotrichia sp. oral taxon 221]|uniref:exonuclease SbcCD subunit D n=1 Tax=Leptotrichia sp. oral taxon 221 TaxID=712362 RepID=UPI001B8BFD80|nr:exonuclease SbcCD subunit D [Leptotrichia sp. oral taxon 221]QUB97760.1 exonuclease SbcCD subunit D [Leptotrichia sp. oral taxon 221]